MEEGPTRTRFSEVQRQLTGYYFMHEYSFETSALFNPSIVRHHADRERRLQEQLPLGCIVTMMARHTIKKAVTLEKRGQARL